MRGGSSSAPMYNLLERPARRPLFSDAPKVAIGSFCLETGVYWRYELDSAVQSRFCGSSKAVAGENDISIDVLELLGMAVSAWVLVSACAERPLATGDCVLLRGDNDAAVEWVRRCHGGKEPQSGTLMRLLGALELSSGWNLDTKHVRGFFNVAAEGISRWDRDLLLFSVTCTPFALMFHGRLRTWGTPGRLSVLRCWYAQCRCGLVSTDVSGAFWHLGRLSDTLWGAGVFPAR